MPDKAAMTNVRTNTGHPLSGIGGVLVCHNEHHPRSFDHRHIGHVLKCRVLHFPVDRKTDDCTVLTDVVFDYFGIVQWLLRVTDVRMAVTAMVDDFVQDLLKDALDLAIFIFVNVWRNTPPLSFEYVLCAEGYLWFWR